MPPGRARRAGAALLLALAGCATHPGHYYADDGPPEHAPAGLASLPDAVPRIEAINPHANRPYAALGHSYTPDLSGAPFEQRGIASWYGRQFHGNRTASGEPYDMYAMSAAHPTLPIPSYARVTNVRDGRSVIVRINDRGPFLRDRIIDLSYAAAVRLGLAGPGSGEVIVQKITTRDIAAGPRPAPALPEPGATAVVAGGAPALAALAAAAMPAGSGSGNYWSVQLGAFAVPANATALRERLALLLAAPEADGLPAAARLPRVEQDGKLNRVLIGKLGDRAGAQAWARQLQAYLLRDTTLYQR